MACNENKINKPVKGTLLTLLGGICWGFSGTCGQYLFTYKNIESGWLTMVRMIAAGIVLSVFLLLKKDKGMKGIWKSKKDIFFLFLFAIGGLLFSQYTYLTAIYYSNAGTATVLQYLNPVLIMILVCMASHKLPNKIEVVCIILALTGTFLIATHGNIHTLSILKEGLFWGILSAVAAVCYSLLPGRLIYKWGSMVVTGYGMLAGGILFGAFRGEWKKDVVYDAGTIFGVLAISIIGTAVAYTLFLQGIQEIGAIKASMIASVEPVAASLFSFLWLKTPFALIDIVGFALIMTTVFLLSRKPKK